MESDEQECKSARYARGALVIPLSTGNFGVCTKWHEFVGTCDAAGLVDLIMKAHELSRKTREEALRPIIKKPTMPQVPVGNPDDLGL